MRKRGKVIKQQAKVNGIGGLPSAVANPAGHARLQKTLGLSLQDDAALHSGLSDVLLLFNTAELLCRRYPEYKGTDLERVVLELEPLLKRVGAALASGEAADTGDRIILAARVAELLACIGLAPHVRVATCEDQAFRWMQRNKRPIA